MSVRGNDKTDSCGESDGPEKASSRGGLEAWGGERGTVGEQHGKTANTDETLAGSSRGTIALQRQDQDLY